MNERNYIRMQIELFLSKNKRSCLADILQELVDIIPAKRKHNKNVIISIGLSFPNIKVARYKEAILSACTIPLKDKLLEPIIRKAIVENSLSKHYKELKEETKVLRNKIRELRKEKSRLGIEIKGGENLVNETQEDIAARKYTAATVSKDIIVPTDYISKEDGALDKAIVLKMTTKGPSTRHYLLKYTSKYKVYIHQKKETSKRYVGKSKAFSGRMGQYRSDVREYLATGLASQPIVRAIGDSTLTWLDFDSMVVAICPTYIKMIICESILKDKLDTFEPNGYNSQQEE